MNLFLPERRSDSTTGEQYGDQVDMKNGPQPLLDADTRFEEAIDAYKAAAKIAHQAREQMGVSLHFSNSWLTSSVTIRTESKDPCASYPHPP